MRILHLLNELRFSGAELLLFSAADELNDFAHHSVLSTGDKLGEYAPHLAARGYATLHLPFSKSPLYFVQLWKLIRNSGFDIVHVHAERAAFWHCLIVRLAGKQCLRTVHNTFLFDGGLRTRRGFGRRLLQRLGVPHIACSTRVAENEWARFKLKTQVIQNWFDPARVTLRSDADRITLRKTWSIPTDVFVISSVGNSGAAKNHEAIIDCVNAVGETLNLHYIHCGASNESVRSRARPLPEKRIRFLGPTPEIDELLAITDVFVSPSFFEGGPIALIEAAAAGCLCVTTNVGLANEFVSDDAVTFIEPSSESLASALEGLVAADPSRRRTDGRRLAERVRRDFSPSVGAACYRKAYEALAERSRTSRRTSVREPIGI